MRFCDSTFTHTFMCAHAAGRCSIRHRVAAPSSQHFLIPPLARATSPMSRRSATAEPYRELVPSHRHPLYRVITGVASRVALINVSRCAVRSRAAGTAAARLA